MNYEFISQITPSTLAIVLQTSGDQKLLNQMESTLDYLFDGAARNITEKSTCLVQGKSFGKALYLIHVNQNSELRPMLKILANSTSKNENEQNRILLVSLASKKNELEKLVRYEFSEISFYPLN